MEEILVVGNPRKRRKSRRRKMSAKQRMYFGGGRKRRRTRRNPVGAYVTGSGARPNPARRRRRRSTARRAMSRVRRAARSYSLRGIVSNPMGTLKPALTGAIGATIVNTVLARVPLPAALMTGNVRYLTQGVAAIVLAMGATKIGGVGAATASKMAEGALTVTLHGAIQQLGGMMGVNLGGLGYYLPGYGATSSPAASGSPARLAAYMTGPGSRPGGSVVPMRRGMAGAHNFNF